MRSYIVLSLLLLITLPTSADTVYVTPDGAGREDGSEWKHALPAEQLSDGVTKTLQPGDTLAIGSGTYHTPLHITTDGSEGNPITIKGVDRGDGAPVFEGNWSKQDPEHGKTTIDLGTASHITVRNLILLRWKHGVTTDEDDVNTNITLKHLDIRRVREGIKLKTVRNSRFVDCRMRGYTKRGIRFDVGCRNLEVENCLADHTAGHENWPHEWPFGFIVEDGNGPKDQRDIVFRNCVSRNNVQPRGPDEYWNGDGFVIENGHPDIKFYNCLAYENQDGGWDDKGKGTTYENCISINNGRNFRVWKNASLTNCLSAYAEVRGGSSGAAGLWAKGEVSLTNCTFHNNRDEAIAVEGGSVTANYCLFSAGTKLADTDVTPDLSGTNNVHYKPDRDIDPPDFVNDDPNWRGTPRNAFNSTRYGPDIGCFLRSDDR